jgi:F0F1-type ATP synthase assembly protein I
MCPVAPSRVATAFTGKVPLKGSPREPHPIAEAAKWVGILTTIGLEMVLPALLGHWLDRRFGFRFLALVGLVIGFAIGLLNLVQIARQSNSESGPRNGS